MKQANRGPLLTIALALLGNGSFIAERMARPEAFIYPDMRDESNTFCVDQSPIIRLLNNDEDSMFLPDECLGNDVFTYDDVQRQVITYIHLLYWNREDKYEGESIANAFTSAAFIANEVWLTHAKSGPGWWVKYDLGADTLVPVISPAGIIVVSVLLGTFLASLLGLAIYSARSPRWTEQLDAFAMLRIGASIADDIQFRPTSDDRQVRALDELPGWVGDATGGEGELGALALGGSGKLGKERKFAAYTVETDDKEE